MPLYEYRCPSCTTTFEQLRGPALADSRVTCPDCGGSEATRILSLFASSVKVTANGAAAPQPLMARGASCCGGGCGCH